MDQTLKSRDVATEIRALARLHAVTYERSRLDDLADDITRLAGDEVKLDEVERLLIALGRAGVLDARELTRYQAAYLRQVHP